MEVTKQYRTETGHRLNNYDGKCSHVHGHSYLWEVTVKSEWLDPCGMVIDFKHLKTAMVDVLEPLDHAMVFHIDDPFVKSNTTEELNVLFRATNGAQPRLFIWPVNPTAENFAGWAAAEIQKALYPGITVTRVNVWETVNSCATWSIDDEG